MKRRKFLTGGALACGSFLLPDLLRASPLRPPVARVTPVTEVLWGQSVTDPYRWMENPADPDWLPFLQGQTNFARRALEALPLRAKLLKRISALSSAIAQATYPKIAGDMSFVQKREADASNYRIVAIDSTGREAVLADPADFAKANASASIDWWQPSPNGKYLVFGVSLAGTEAAVGYVVDVVTGKRLDDRLEHVPYAAPSWLPDSSGFFYNRFAGRPAASPDYYNDRSVWLHRVGSAQSSDQLVIKTGTNPAVPMNAVSSPEIQVGVGSTYLALFVRDGYVREFALYVAEIASVIAGKAVWRRICGPRDGISDFALSGTSLFLVSTSSAPRGELLLLNAAQGTLANASKALPAGDAVLDELTAGRSGTYVTLNDGGEQSLLFVPVEGSARTIALPFTGWIQSVAVSPVDGQTLVRITSWLEPGAIFAIDSVTGTALRSSLQKRPDIDLSPYETRRIFATARDGTKIPISVVARKGKPKAAAPCLVHVYGAYQWPSQPVFDVRGVAFLEAGGVIATAHVRGGGEYGRMWHEQGQKSNKPNTWRDLIACCETLIAQGYTARKKIAIIGGSAGGIAVGRAMTERPDLFGAVISKVGMSNPLRAEFEPNGKPNIPEFGTVTEKAGFEALMAMDSFRAVQQGVSYPAILLSTGINDARVAPHNAAKMAARLQAANPKSKALLVVNFEAGHEANSLSKNEADAEYADDFAFVLANTAASR